MRPSKNGSQNNRTDTNLTMFDEINHLHGNQATEKGFLLSTMDRLT